uniref:fas-binding factor 1 isoform X1 n=1 Tax=Halichoerus grypus TaxID=9711 RepID=UPI0016593459|nr:fas-binding factor 1 isoform X1 [Halichoerus grypus]XP_035944427.1 fas-binding factor 1 isoform X1 [Halichoerus grypus]XP_035944428.1 fas-binding factor 1 isoform X1 [Halichoerus grypus]XP_035944429.1 fas-binding factor 1 isoform X1 [Halichoerus grypus]
MAPKTKKGLKGSIDDVLGDLLGDETTLPEEPVKLASRARDAPGAAQALPSSQARTKSLLEDYAFDTTAGIPGPDAEVSDVSDADPQILLQAMKDLDDMDADLLGLKRSNLASSKRAAKGPGKEELPSHPKPAGILTAGEKGDTVPAKKPPPSPSSLGHQYRKFSFEDLEDPLAGLLSDDEEGITKKPPGTESKMASEKSPAPVRNQGPSIPLTPGDTPVRKKEEVLFDEEDDVVATLGFADSPTAERRQTGDQERPRPARSRLDELLGRGTAAKLLARPGTGEHREFKLDKKYQRPQDKEDSWGDEDFTFGAYQPTMGSCEGRQSHRQSVSRFLTEGGADTKGEPGSKQSTPAASSPTHPRKGGADWLGLKDDDLLPPSPTREAQRGGSALSTPSVLPPRSQHSDSGRCSAPAGLPSSSLGPKPPTESAGFPAKASQPSQLGVSKDKEEEDWLSHALSRKKSQGLAREEHTEASKGQNLVGAGGSPPSSSQPVPSTQGFKQAAAGGPSGTATQKPPTRPATSGSPVTWKQAALTLPAGDPKRGTALGDLSSIEPAACVPSSQEPPGPSVPAQSLLLESLAQSPLPGADYQRQLLAAQVHLQSGTAELQADLLQSQARLAELEAQVRKLELERTQHRLLLESLQQRHQADLELVESAHRSRVKVLETSYQQREERLRREHEELSARYLSYCQEAEQARAELAAQHQQRLAAAMQEKDHEMERLRELQRASILEMRQDHEEQLQRLKLLKDREIDAVTSATSHTRSLNSIIEQMEKFSSSLHELSSRVEASHLTTAQERELGFRQRDQQLRVLQERLGQQQRDMEEERSRLQEVIGKMEARLNEQSRLLEQERWRVNAEQSRAESTQRGLEEQRKVMVQQITMEREELEKAKSALLEEQKSVMRKCGEERRRLAAEWAEFYAQQKLSKERAEREAERALQVDTQREGTLISLAKEQAELKIRASELRAKEDQLAAEREALERERQELRLEKERVSAAALRTRLRAEEVESMSQVASEKLEEGQRALREARQVQQEQQARLQLVERQQERLRQQEQRVHQEHLSLAQQRLLLDHIRQDLPSSPVVLLPRTQGPAASCLGATVAPAATAPGCSRPPAGLGPSYLHAKLVLLKHTAEQDRDFLENEQFFLETLKKASYNMTSHSA